MLVGEGGIVAWRVVCGVEGGRGKGVVKLDGLWFRLKEGGNVVVI